MLNVHRMRVLRELARRGSIAAAAEALSLTPSAASQHIAMLERETGVALVERTARSVRLTEAGRALAEHTDEVLARLAAAEASIRAIAGLEVGTLRLASFSTAGATVLASAIAAFRRRWPAVALRHVEGEPETVLPLLGAGEVDLALVYDYGESEPVVPAGIELDPLLEDPVFVALPPGDGLERETAVPLAELAAAKWIAGSETSWCARFTERVCRGAGFDPDIAFRTDDYGVACALVQAEVGVAFVPELALPPASAIAIRPLRDDAPARTVLAAYRRGSEQVPAIAAMLEALHAAAAERIALRGPV